MRVVNNIKYPKCPIFKRASTSAYALEKCRCEVCRKTIAEIDRNSKKTPQYKEKCKYKQIKYKYGITKQQYKELELMQGKACAICKKSNVSLEVDHCHESKKIRGLLCGNCNKAIGLLKDNSETARAAAKYLNVGDQ